MTQSLPKIIYAFPHAGAAASSYRKWTSQTAAESGITIVALDLPGRGSLVRTRPISVLQELIEWQAEAIRADLEERGGADAVNWFTFGHSFGGVLSFAVGAHLEASGGIAPRCSIISGSVAPNVQLQDNRHLMPVEQIRQKARLDNGTPEAVLNDPVLGKRVVEQLRADYIIRSQFTALIDTRVTYPQVYVRGDADEFITDESVEWWRRSTSSTFEVIPIRGGHFAIYDNWMTIYEVVATKTGDESSSVEFEVST